MLIANYSYVNQICGHVHSGITVPNKFFAPHRMRGYYVYADVGPNEESIEKDSFPTGTYPPYSLMLSDKGGLLSATTSVTGINGFSNLNLAGGLNGESTLSGAGDLTGQLSALAFLISALSGSGNLSGSINAAVSIAANLAGNGDLNGTLSALVEIAANLNGAGDLSGQLASAIYMTAGLVGSGDLVGGIQAVVQILADLTGSGALSGAIIGNWSMVCALSGSNSLVADINAFAHILSDLTSSGTISLSSGAVPGDLSAIITSCSDLSPESLASAVWSALQVSINNPGTAGAALLAAGSAGDPWSTILPASYTGTQAGAILDRIQTLIDELHKVQGLKAGSPMTVTQTQRTVDSIVLDLTGDGENITIVTRQP